MSDLLDIIKTVIAAVGTGSVLVAAFSYWRDTNRRRAALMMSFYEKFYEGPQLKKVRYLLNSRAADYEDLRRATLAEKSNEQTEQLDDYLNFFEFIASLWTLKQLSLKNILVLFEFYLRDMQEHDWLIAYLNAEKNGFEYLRSLLKTINNKSCR